MQGPQTLTCWYTVHVSASQQDKGQYLIQHASFHFKLSLELQKVQKNLTFLLQVISGVGLPLTISQLRLAGSPSFTIRTPSEGTGRISGATEMKIKQTCEQLFEKETSKFTGVVSMKWQQDISRFAVCRNMNISAAFERAEPLKVSESFLEFLGNQLLLIFKPKEGEEWNRR